MFLSADRGGIAALVLLTLVGSTSAWAQTRANEPRSPQEERRRKLLEEMGLEEQRPTTPPTAPPPSAGASDAAPASDTANERAAPGEHAKKSVEGGGQGRSSSFRGVIHPLFMQTCKTCHNAGGKASATPLVLSGDAGADHAAIMRVLNLRTPSASLLLLEASGKKPHAGGAPWPLGGPAYDRVLAWIQAGARLDRTSADAVVPPPPDSSPGLPSNPRPSAHSSGPPAASKAIADSEPVAESERPATATTASGPTVPATVDFAGRVHPLLMASCAPCHGTGGPAASTRLILSGALPSDYARVRALVNPTSPSQSILIAKAAGQEHAGGPVFPVGSAGHKLLMTWVTEGATERAGAGVNAGPASLTASVGAAAATPGESTAPHASPASATVPHDGSGLALPYGLWINGRFDLAFERREFSGNPFGDTATNGLRSYHHFLFLSRESTDDPVGLFVEMLSLQFWEIHYRWRATHLPLEVVIAAGKILVPFGADPLMHQSYGGLSGFDQRILPVIWAQEGMAAHVIAHRAELAITDDIYLVRGYTLQQADGILNLQSDFSPDDNARIGWGNRLGGAWGPLSAWYSAYYNRLGFGRRLFMQAADVMLYRMRQVPIVGHFSFAAGLLRADVSGGNAQGTGGPGKDYYDFGSYFQVRYHPNDWLYLQYRQGLRTFNNRRGVIIDDSRLTSDDGSTHNFGVVARTHGLTAGIYYFINLEKVAEVPNDLLRVSLSYDF